MLYDSDEVKPIVQRVVEEDQSPLTVQQEQGKTPGDNSSVDWSELDWTGWKENSLTTQLGQYVKSKLDPTYIVPGSLQDLEEQEAYINSRIGKFEDFNSDYAREKVGKLYEELQDVQSQRSILAAQDEDIDLEAVWDAVVDDPERFAFNVAQETINKPELIAAGSFGGWGWGVLGTKAAQAANLGVKAAKVAKVAGALTGSYTGGVALGTIDRSIESANRTGEFQLAQSLEQSHIDGVIGAASYGLLAAARKGTRGIVGTKNTKKFKEELPDIDSTDITETMEKFSEEEVPQSTLNKEAMHPVDTEVYVDPQGNTFVMEMSDIQQASPNPWELAAASENKLRPKELESLRSTRRKGNREVARWTNQVDDLETIEQTPEVEQKLEDLRTKIADKQKEVANIDDRLYEHQKALQAQEELYGETQDGLLDNPEYLQVPSPDGQGTVLLKKADPDISLKQNNVMIDGFSHSDFSMQGQASGYQNPWEAIMTNWFRSATAPLQGIRETSPSAALLLEKLNPNAQNPKAQMWSLQEDITFKQGEFNNRLRDVMLEVKDRYPGDDFESKVMLHMRNVEVSEDPAIVKASTDLRQILEDHRDYMNERGAKVERVEDYLPRRWDKEKLGTPEGQKQFVERLMLTENKTKSEAQESLKNILEDRQEDNGVLTVSGNTVNKTPYGSRTLKKLKDSEVNDLLSEAFFEDITKHLMAGVRRAEMANVFGDGGEVLSKDLMPKISDELKAAGRPLRPDEQQRIYDIYNSFNGRYKPLDNELANVANNAMATSVNLSKLGLATITSLTEPLVSIARLNESSGLGAAARTYGEALRGFARKAFKGLKEHEAITEAREMGLITDQAIAEVLDQMQGVGMDGKLAKINHKFFRLTGLHQWTELSRGMAYGASKTDITKTATRLAKNPNDATRQRWLTEVGLNPEQAVQWINEGGDVTAPFYSELKKASVRMANEIIANPNPVNKPLWMSNPKMKLVAQLKAYPIVFGNVILDRQFKEFKSQLAEGRGGRKAANLAITAGTMVGGYYLLGMLKDTLRGNDLELDDEEKQFRNLTRATVNLLGPVGIVAPVVEGMGERYGSNSLMSAAVPFAGTVGKVIEDPARGLVDAVPGSTLLPTELKQDVVKELKQ